MATWAETTEVPVIGAFAQQAFYSDLMVLGQRDDGDPASSALPPDFVEGVVLATGRPALVLPYVGWEGEIGDTIAIAWKETPQAARAVMAALPLLERSRKVHVLTWGDESRPPLEGHALDLDGYLRLHGVEATWHRGGPEPQAQAMGDLVLSRAFDLDCDLLVMGCYGHSRAREWALGGTSRTVLQAMTLPVLMAH